MTRKTNNKQCVQTDFSSQSEVEGTLMKRVSFLATQYAIKTQLGQGIGTKRLCIQTYDTGTTRNVMLFSQRAIFLFHFMTVSTTAQTHSSVACL